MNESMWSRVVQRVKDDMKHRSVMSLSREIRKKVSKMSLEEKKHLHRIGMARILAGHRK